MFYLEDSVNAIRLTLSLLLISTFGVGCYGTRVDPMDASPDAFDPELPAGTLEVYHPYVTVDSDFLGISPVLGEAIVEESVEIGTSVPDGEVFLVVTVETAPGSHIALAPGADDASTIEFCLENRSTVTLEIAALGGRFGSPGERLIGTAGTPYLSDIRFISTDDGRVMMGPAALSGSPVCVDPTVLTDAFRIAPGTTTCLAQTVDVASTEDAPGEFIGDTAHFTLGGVDAYNGVLSPANVHVVLADGTLGRSLAPTELTGNDADSWGNLPYVHLVF
jgi:hypothetical protein